MLRLMLNAFLQNATTHPAHRVTSMFRHFGAFGLFFLAIVDSSPLPTFGGPDILTAILAATHRNPWYEYAAVATAGSVIGAYLTFRLARKAGSAYLHSKFGHRKLDAILNFFQKWGYRCSCCFHGSTDSDAHQHAFCGRRCFGLRCREISNGRDHLPERTLRIHCNHR
jgi:uncharacterized membrane protein YdjX (TVP38/TMEM64 family)